MKVRDSAGRDQRRPGIWRTLATACVLLALGMSVSGCVVAPAGGWCFYHPYRCR